MAQQIITNPSITPGALQIELSGGYVTAISGHPVGGTGGGSGPSVTYTGVAGEINVDNQQATIGLANEVKEQLSSIPSKVSDLSDSANYYTSAQVDRKFTDLNYTDVGGLVGQLNLKQDKLTFGYDDSAISSINGSAIAGQNDMSQYALKNDLDVVSGEVDILTDSSAKWNEVSAKFDTSSWNAYSGKFQLSGDYANKSDLDLYYKKTETSSKDEISNAIKDFITDDDVTAKNYLTKASGDLYYLPKPNELVEGTQYAYTTQGWSPIQGGGGASGISFVNHDETLEGDGNTVKLGINTSHAMNLTNTSAKSAVSAATANVAVYYYDKSMGGTFEIAHDINDLAAQIEDVSGMATALSSNKLDTTAAANTYQPKGDYATNTLVQNTSAAITALIPSTAGLASERDLQTVSAGVNAVSGELLNYYKKTETSSKDEISTALGNKVDKPSSTLQNKYLVLRTTSGGSVDGWVDFNDNVYSKTEADGRYQRKSEMGNYLTTAKYATDSATFVTSSNTDITGTKQYALTTAGWAEVQVGASLTASSGINIDNNLINVTLGRNLKFDTYSSVTTEDNISAISFRAGEYNNQYTIVNKDGLEAYFTSSPITQTLSLNTNGLNNSLVGGNRCITADYNLNHLFFKSYDNNGTYSGDYSQVEVKVLQEDQPAETQHRSSIKLTDYYGGVEHTGLITVEKIAQWDQGGSVGNYVPYSATVLPIGTNNTATNNSIAIGSNNTADNLGFAVGQSNTALKQSLAFGVNNYANDISLAVGYGNTASGRSDSNQSAVNIAMGYGNSAANHAAAFINTCTAENYSFAAGNANSAIDNSVAFCRNTSAYFYSFGFGHSNFVKNYSYAFGRGLHYEGQWDSGSQYGAFVIGGWNATTSYATTADAPLFIIGNGSNNNPSDGFIVYRDGSVSAAGKISANGMFAVSTEATLFGQSRIANVGDTTALGTNWMGVTNDGQGFLKAVAGNNVGSLNGTSIQINYKPNTAYGEITVKNSNAGTESDSKIVHVPTASYNNMTTFDPVNGPNYMLRKTASGFDIGAKVVNVTSMPQNTDANTYYFVYEV